LLERAGIDGAQLSVAMALLALGSVAGTPLAGFLVSRFPDSDCIYGSWDRNGPLSKNTGSISTANQVELMLATSSVNFLLGPYWRSGTLSTGFKDDVRLRF
jgi:hypothetical protein